MNKISIIDPMTEQVLDEFTLDQEDLAHQKATEYEKLNISVSLVFPSSVEQLGVALGVDQNQLDGLKCAMNEELSSHNE